VSTLPPPRFDQDEGRIDILRDLSRERYAQKRADVEERIMRWAAGAAEAKVTAKKNEKANEQEEEETKQARANKMTLEQYRAWRDREMWTNEYNALRKRVMLGEPLDAAEQSHMSDLERKLEASGGVPPPSKSMFDAVEKAKKAAEKANNA